MTENASNKGESSARELDRDHKHKAHRETYHGAVLQGTLRTLSHPCPECERLIRAIRPYVEEYEPEFYEEELGSLEQPPYPAHWLCGVCGAVHEDADADAASIEHRPDCTWKRFHDALDGKPLPKCDGVDCPECEGCPDLGARVECERLKAELADSRTLRLKADTSRSEFHGRLKGALGALDEAEQKRDAAEAERERLREIARDAAEDNRHCVCGCCLPCRARDALAPDRPAEEPEAESVEADRTKPPPGYRVQGPRPSAVPSGWWCSADTLADYAHPESYADAVAACWEHRDRVRAMADRPAEDTNDDG